MVYLQRRKQDEIEQPFEKIVQLYPQFEHGLLERRDKIIGQNHVARSNLDEQLMTSPGDAADESVLDTSADYFLRLANNHQHELVEIRDAIDRLHRGVYGICENCENTIAMERLKYLPYARFCIDCQAAREKNKSFRPLSKV